MTRQTSVREVLPAAIKGMAIELFKKVRSFVNSTPQIVTFTVTAANILTTATINGTGVTVNSGGATLSTSAIATLLAAAINALTATLGVTAETSSATVIVYSVVPGTAFTYVGTTNCSVALNVPNAGYIPFGSFVSQDYRYADRCHLPYAATDVTSIKNALGIALRTLRVENPSDYGYALNEVVDVMTNGVCWVVAELAVTPASDVYVRYASGGAGTVLGAFTTGADSSSAGALPSARWMNSASAGELALVEINLP